MLRARILGLSAVSAAAMMAFAILHSHRSRRLSMGCWRAVGRCGCEMRRRTVAQGERHQGHYRNPRRLCQARGAGQVRGDQQCLDRRSTSELSRMAAEGLIEEIDWEAIDPKPMFDEAKNEFGLARPTIRR